jgi:hypothetical protein
MSEEKEQGLCIKLCVNHGKNGAEIFEMLQTALGDERLSRARTFEWRKESNEGRNSVDDGPGDNQRAWKGLFTLNVSRKVKQQISITMSKF